MKCPHKHTEFQPNDSEWKCPNCGADSEYFYVLFSVSKDCELLHCEDWVVCDRCGLEQHGEVVAQMMASPITELFHNQQFWDAVKLLHGKQYIYVTTDANNITCIHTKKPHIENELWESNDDFVVLEGIKPYCSNWEESLMEKQNE